MLKVYICIFTFALSTAAFAQDPAVNPLNFQAWKEQQLLEAQNQTLRVSARISQLKAAKPSATVRDVGHLPNGKIKKTEADSVASAERDMRRAQDSLQTANALNLEDYVTIYLPTLQGQPDALSALAQKMSKEELIEIFKILAGKQGASTDAKRNAAHLADSLTITSRAKAQ